MASAKPQGKQVLTYTLGNAVKLVQELWPVLGEAEAYDWDKDKGVSKTLYYDTPKELFDEVAQTPDERVRIVKNFMLASDPAHGDDSEETERAVQVPDFHRMADSFIDLAKFIERFGLYRHLEPEAEWGSFRVTHNKTQTKLPVPQLKEIMMPEDIFTGCPEYSDLVDAHKSSAVMNTLRNIASTKSTLGKTKGSESDIAHLEKLLIWGAARGATQLLDQWREMRASVERYIRNPNEMTIKKVEGCANLWRRFASKDSGRGARCVLLGWIRYAHAIRNCLDADMHRSLPDATRKYIEDIHRHTDVLRSIKTPEVVLDGSYAAQRREAKRPPHSGGSRSRDNSPVSARDLIRDLCEKLPHKIRRVHVTQVTFEMVNGELVQTEPVARVEEDAIMVM